MPRMPRVTLVLDPRFPGGTATAVAAEVAALRGLVDLRVVALRTRMLEGHEPNPHLLDALDRAGLSLEWDPAVVRAEAVVLHNPSCLKFDNALATRIACDRLIVVTHENFLRPGGAEGFDVAHCLGLIDAATLCRARALAPVSPHNRAGVAAWLSEAGGPWAGALASEDWFNVCAFVCRAPTATPRDRRGRLSRPGPEKFPPMAAMRRHFPPHAEICAILGGDALLAEGRDDVAAHWTVLPFGAVAVDRFLEGIDFFVYFTNPLWRESFGRVIAEAIAAGKVVITDPQTAAAFGDAVIASDGGDVDGIVSDLVADPARYGALVRAAQDRLARFSPAAFARRASAMLDRTEGVEHALL